MAVSEVDERRRRQDAPAIETTALARAFGDHVAVRDVSFSVRSGETFGLIGPNGAVKSTLVKMLTTMLAPTSGHARVAGFGVAVDSRKVRAHIGYIPQLLSADGALTAYENRANMLLRVTAASFLWAVAVFIASGAEGAKSSQIAYSGSETIAQSCTTGDRDRCYDQATRCFRNCDTLERCNRSCCLEFHDCLSSHGCNLDAAICKGF